MNLISREELKAKLDRGDDFKLIRYRDGYNPGNLIHTHGLHGVVSHLS